MKVIVDRENVNDESVIVQKLHKKNGDVVQVDDLVVEIETSKTVTEVRSPAAGRISIALAEGDEIAVGTLLFEVAGEETGAASALSPEAAKVAPAGEAKGGLITDGSVKVSKAAQELAAKLSVDIRQIKSRGWVTAADVAEAAGQPVAAPPAPVVAPAREAPAAAATEAMVLPRVAHHTKKTALRKRSEARNLARANGSGTTSTIGVEVAVSGYRLVEPPFLFQGTVADILIFEAARLLRAYPELNAFYIDERNFGYYDAVNFGVSFDSGQNLKVLSLSRADHRSLSEIQVEFQNLLELYEAGSQIPEDILSGSTVTLSDLSGSGAHFMLPLLNGNQSLILGVTRPSSDRFVVFASFDHRVSEGLQVANFLKELIERLQSHFRPGGRSASMQRCAVCDATMANELALGRRSMTKVVLADGQEGLLCRSCFDGW